MTEGFDVQTLAILLAFAFLVEAVIENVKWAIDDIRAIIKQDSDHETEWNGSRLIALVLAIAFSVAFGVDAWELLGFDAAIPYVGAIGTGILMARGANFFHDLISKLGD